LTALTVLVAAGTAVASPPRPVTITVDTTLGDPNAVDPFVATGGVICSAGEVSTPITLFVGFQSGSHAQIITVKHFVCPDGTFDILLRVTLDFMTFATRGTWSVLRGTGAYVKLHGSGTLTGENMGDSILDRYAGSMHID
jgi:hypothetical protein